MPEDSTSDDLVDDEVDDGNDRNITSRDRDSVANSAEDLVEDSIVFIVRVRQARGQNAGSAQTAVPCRGTVEHLETRTRHYFLTWPDLVGHLSQYVQCDEMTQPLANQTGWRNFAKRMQMLVSRWWRPG